MIAGTTLADRYQLTNRIAVGGMGEVWSALDQVLGREVAVKVLRPEYVDDAEFRERFRAEARHAAGLSHPGIASVYDFGEQTDPEPAAWLVMELVDGEPLSALLRRSPQLPTGQALDIVGQAALALGAAHEAGVVHRDVKPGNLLVRPDGVVKVTDFGIARAVDAVSVTRTGTLVGTAHYLSPEQAGGRPVLPASDVYSLGLVAYECLAGVRPFPVDNPVAAATAHLTQTPPPLPQTVPAEVRALVMRTLAKDPAERPAHAGELGRQALALRTGMTAPATAEVTTVLASAAADPTRMLPVAQPAPAGASTLLPPRPGATRRPAGQQHRRFVRLASAALGVVLLGVGLSNCIGADGSRSTAASASSTPSASAVPRVAVNNADYAGRAPAGVQALLADRGLRSRLVYDGRGTPAGTVATVTPTGSLPLASTVVVHVVPVKTDEEDRDERGKGKGRGKDDD